MASERRLAEIRERLAAATPGPWELYATGRNVIAITKGRMRSGYRREIVHWSGFDCSNIDDPGQVRANAALIAHAPSDLAYLLDEIARLTRELEALRRIAVDLHWMARRYVDGRSSYATGLFNAHTRALITMGVELNPTGDGTIWARDAMGRAYDGLSEEEAALGLPAPDGLHDEDVARLRRELEEARELLRQIAADRCRCMHPFDICGTCRARRAIDADTKGGDADPPAHPARMAQPDEGAVL